MGPERFALALTAVAGVIPLRPLVPLPGSGPAMRGLFGHDGRLIAAIDLTMAIAGIGSGSVPTRLVLLREPAGSLAVLADEVAEAAAVPTDLISSREGSGPVRAHASLSAGIAAILDPSRLAALVLPAPTPIKEP